MKKSLKAGLGITFVVVLAILGGLFWVFHSLDHLVASAIRTYGSEITGVPVSVGSVHIDLGEGSATIRNLRVANPDGFKASHALELHEISLGIAIDSISKPVLVINQFTMDSLDVNYETIRKGSNFDVINGNINRYMSSLGSKKKGAAPAGEENAGKPAPDKKFILRKVDITGGKMTAESYLLAGKKLDAEMPDIHLRNIGQARGGATPGQVGKEIFDAIARSAARAAARAAKGGAMDKLKGDAGEKLKGLFN